MLQKVAAVAWPIKTSSVAYFVLFWTKKSFLWQIWQKRLLWLKSILCNHNSGITLLSTHEIIHATVSLIHKKWHYLFSMRYFFHSLLDIEFEILLSGVINLRIDNVNVLSQNHYSNPENILSAKWNAVRKMKC